MSGRWVALREAAEVLESSTEAVRKRALRGSIRSRKDQDGHVLVWVDEREDNRQPPGEVEAYRELIEELRDRVRSLEDANRENRRIIAALTQRIPEIEAPAEPPGAPESVVEELERSEPRPATGGAQAGAERPWWRAIPRWRRRISGR